ncbi:MAG: bifunctional 3-(3-hydroxy-phenyl)propionate/3-hydroxycinnamic acid hydroxylase [Pseudomonadales bacterium]|nr:bifunctional 3-(3-hydroxy-phenyl)propionate/3-hydroxycinnamic acid hydroxylase [Pseudomonadales bacterium]
MSLPATASVLIVGGGPVGLTLANLLGSEGIPTLLVERNPGCVAEPRAVALDGESLRTLQAVGLAKTVSAHIRQGFVADYLNGAGELLFTTDLTARPYGFCIQNSFDQPTLERQLLRGLARFPCVTVCHSTQLLDFHQDEDGVSATLRDSEGEMRKLRVTSLVGCDGGRSGVRQRLGIAMHGERLPQRWLVIDTVDPHLGEEPACRFFCDPRRPAMTIVRPGGERRWEWMLIGDETDEEMLEDTRIRTLLGEHTEPGQVQVYRKCVYSFSAVVARAFSAGRVFLAGDAAHMTPPFAGQGLNAGIRDARNLSWKLAAVITERLPRQLLGSYDLERREAARQMVDLAVELGDRIQPTDPAVAAERDALFAALNSDPVAAANFGVDAIAPLRDVRLPRGWFAGPCGGRLLPQPELAGSAGPLLLDELLGKGFTALLRGVRALPERLAAHPLWRQLAPAEVHLDPAARQALAGFIDSDRPGITLLRPDRFVLADLAADDSESLDTLLRQLQALQAA